MLRAHQRVKSRQRRGSNSATYKDGLEAWPQQHVDSIEERVQTVHVLLPHQLVVLEAEDKNTHSVISSLDHVAE